MLLRKSQNKMISVIGLINYRKEKETKVNFSEMQISGLAKTDRRLLRAKIGFMKKFRATFFDFTAYRRYCLKMTFLEHCMNLPFLFTFYISFFSSLSRLRIFIRVKSK